METLYKSSLHILLLNYEFPPLGGGAGVVSKILSEKFVELGHRVTIITTWYYGEKETYNSPNLEIIRLKSKRKELFKSNPIEMYSWMKMTLNYLKNQSQLPYDICFTNFTLPGGVPALWLKQNKKIPFIVLSHGHDVPWFYPKKMFFWHLLTYFKIKEICNESSYNVVVSDEMKHIIDKFLNKKNSSKNIVLNNGIDTGNIDKKFEGKHLKILFVGRLVEQKDPFTFLKTIKELQSRNIPFECSILGDGDLRSSMEEYAVTHNIQNIFFKGKVGHNEVFNYYRDSHILISSSINEGMSVAILEAASQGLYIIATPASGNNKIVQEGLNGNLLPFGDYRGMCDKVEEFYHDKFLKGYEYFHEYIHEFEQKFSWHSIANEYITLFQQAILQNKK